ncbi:Dynein light chain [Malassezia sp. CBS 17886]|nr:Dynein light chain [Malassezia sp. CBS 17886]
MSGTTPADGAEAQDVPRAIVKNVDMEPDMQQAVVEIAAEALVKFSVEKDMAAHVKRAVDAKFGPTWHIIVGRSFGSFVTHESKHFIYFYLGPIAFLIWRA